jgi:uncharacterized protein (DUF2236 family)
MSMIERTQQISSLSAVAQAYAVPSTAREARPMTRIVNAERLVLLGWSRAVLLQFAHPLVAAGVYDHSRFRATPWAAARRLDQTIRAMLALTFGTEPERQRVLEGVLGIHRRVHGHLPFAVGVFAAGTKYSAEDPALVLWVHATLLESLPMFYELLVAPLDAADHDAYCAEAASVAVALGAAPSDVPRTRAALVAYMDRVYRSGQLAVGEHARALAARVLSPPFGPLGAPAAAVNHLLTVAMLPTNIRSQYGFEWTSRDERALELAVPALRALRKVLPRVAATWRAARRRQ